jgi:tRNA G18 (ribose-2'-O)-methylase SpoU
LKNSTLYPSPLFKGEVGRGLKKLVTTLKNENIFGLHSVQALLKSAPQRVLEVFMVQGRNDQRLTKILNLAQGNDIS